MAGWSEVEAEAPELAARAKGFLDAHTHLTIATLRRDGSPRISGTEIRWHDGDLHVGGMWRAMKALDLHRDPRYAPHSGSDDPDDGWEGDAKLAGRAEELSEDEASAVFPDREGSSRCTRSASTSASSSSSGSTKRASGCWWTPGKRAAASAPSSAREHPPSPRARRAAARSFAAAR